MIGAMLVSVVESIGDYYACAQLAGAAASGAVISRGLGSEGIGLLLCGLFGTGNGTTSYGENVGALSVTRWARAPSCRLARASCSSLASSPSLAPSSPPCRGR